MTDPSPAPRTVTVATKTTAGDARRLAAACQRLGVTRSTFLHEALLAALRELEAGDAHIDLVASEEAMQQRAPARSTSPNR